MIIGHLDTLEEINLDSFLPAGSADWWAQILEELSPGDNSDVLKMWLPGKVPHKLVLGALPTTCSRHNSPSHPHAITAMILEHLPKEEQVNLVLALDSSSDRIAVSCAVARAFPLYSSKSNTGNESNVRVHYVSSDGPVEQLDMAEYAAEAVRFAASLVD